MRDPRLDKLADVLVNYSVHVQKGEKVLIEARGIDAELVKALIEKVWSESDINDYRTVDSHVKRLRKLLGDYGDCIQTVWGLGYKLVMKE